MDGESRSFVTRPSAEFRSFAVEAWVDHHICGWPFGRFDIAPGELRVRLSFPWFTARSAQADAIQSVLIRRRRGDMSCIRFDDDAAGLADVRVYPVFRLEQILDELRRCEYTVFDDGPPARPFSRR